MRVVDVRVQDLVGSLFTGEEGRPRPGILVLGGSEGGMPNHLAGLLAREGFSCLALAYFRAAGLPRRLAEIPLEYVQTGLAWLAAHQAVGGRRLGVVGESKGAELALLTAASFPEATGAVVAYAPSSVVFAGIGPGDAQRRSSWSYRGQPVAFVPYPPKARPSVTLRGLSVAPVYEAALDDIDAVTAAAIPVEQTRAPMLLISGDKDRMWPASRMAEMVGGRLSGLGRGHQVTHLRYPNAGHSLAPWKPNGWSWASGCVYDLGGRPRDNRAAVRDAWPKAVDFLRHSLAT